MLWPPIRFSFDTVNYELASPAPSPPSRENWLGTDDQGRDVLARAIYGFRISVLFGLALTLASTVIGVLAGAVQGYFGGWVDLGFQRFIEIWSSLPELYLLMILASVVEPNFGWLLLIMLLFSWMALVGVVRAEFLRARNFEYVRAARALGVGDLTIMLRHVLPNAMVASLTFLPFILNGSIVTLTSLDFLGFGMPPGFPVARRARRTGEGQSPRALARDHRVLGAGRAALPPHLRLRGGARRLRPPQDRPLLIGPPRRLAPRIRPSSRGERGSSELVSEASADPRRSPLLLR